jgi:hypothetical protein
MKRSGRFALASFAAFCFAWAIPEAAAVSFDLHRHYSGKSLGCQAFVHFFNHSLTFTGRFRSKAIQNMNTIFGCRCSCLRSLLFSDFQPRRLLVC